jgi:hypothetical protein
MEALVVIMGLMGLAQQSGVLPQQQHPQAVQQYYNPQTGKYYLYYNGYMYEQNLSQNQGYQNQPSQGMSTPNWTPQPPNGGWYPQQPTQTPSYPQGYYR